MARRFASRVDGWLVGVVFGSLFVGGMAIVVAASVGEGIPPLELGLALLVLIGTGAAMVWMMRTTHYAIEGDQLAVRGGPWRLRIAVADITRVAPSRSLLSSPAWSLDRLEIRYGANRSVLISPDDRDGFLRALRDAGVPAEVISSG